MNICNLSFHKYYLSTLRKKARKVLENQPILGGIYLNVSRFLNQIHVSHYLKDRLGIILPVVETFFLYLGWFTIDNLIIRP